MGLLDFLKGTGGGSPWGAIAGGALSFLNGGNGQANGLMQQSQEALAAEQALGRTYHNVGANEMGNYENQAGAEDSAFQQALDYYRRMSAGPTSQDAAATLQQFSGNIAPAFAGARAELGRDLAARGISGSSVAGGALASLGGQEATAQGDAANQAYMLSLQNQGGALTHILDMITGRRSTEYGRSMDAFGRESGVNRFAAGSYHDLANEAAANEAANTAAMGGGLVSILHGMLPGPKAAGSTSPLSGTGPGGVMHLTDTGKPVVSLQDFMHNGNSFTPSAPASPFTFGKPITLGR
jgi:hypothetical protein